MQKILIITNIFLSSLLFSQQSDTTTIKQKSPWGAVLRSSVLPGLGQIYNESYWKAPVVWGLFVWFGYNWNNNNKEYHNYKNLYMQSVSVGLPNENLRRIREFYRDQRDLFAIYLGLTYFLNLVDAYVDAHLFNFKLLTKNEELILKISFSLN